jgi:hypothetical protein
MRAGESFARTPDGSLIGGLTASGLFYPLSVDALGGLGVVGTRQLPIIKGSIPDGQTTYSGQQCIGGLVQVATGLPAGTVLASVSLKVKLLYSNLTAGSSGALLGMLFDANPAASTFTDGSNISLAAADVPKLITYGEMTMTTVGAFSSGIALYALTATRLQVDASGIVYFALGIGTTGFVTTAANVLSYEFDASL